MKKTKLIVPALGLLLVSTAASVSGTVAWFSMNTSVTATSMTVSAVSDSKWLVINTGASFNANGVASTAVSEASAELYPAAPATTITSANVEAEASWHYAYSAANDSATKNGDYVVVSDGTLANYVTSESFWIGLSNKSGSDSASNLKLTSVELPANTGISCVVVCGSNCYTHRTSASPLTEALATSVTKTGVEVKVYYFIDGDNENVYTNNIASLTGTLTLTFAVD